MANNLSSNTTEDLARVFTEKFESSAVVMNTVNTQLLTPRLTPSTGGEVSFKRPHDAFTIRTAGGDISSSTKGTLIAGKSTGVVQDFLTTAVEWSILEEALELDQLDQILEPYAARIATDLDLALSEYIIANAALHYGTPGTAVDDWADVAGANALLQSVGVPMSGDQTYLMNPFATIALADQQNSLQSGNTDMIRTAWEKAQTTRQFGGMRAITSNAMKNYTSGTLTAGANRAGTLNGTPVATYASVKDTMIQSIVVAGFGAGSDTIKAGEIVQVTGRSRLNLSTRELILGRTGSEILWSGTVTADVTLSGGGGTLLVAGPAIIETDGQYNTVASALTSGDVITILNPAASTAYQPSMFYHKEAFGLGTVKLPKLFSTDTVATSKDGISIRVSKYSDGDANTQKVRFDVLPAFITFNPFFAGQGFGV